MCLASLDMCTRKGTTLGWRCIMRTTMLQTTKAQAMHKAA
jgi:hypothetical protein